MPDRAGLLVDPHTARGRATQLRAIAADYVAACDAADDYARRLAQAESTILEQNHRIADLLAEIDALRTIAS